MKQRLWNKVGHDSCLCCVSLTLILWPYPSCCPSIMNRCCKTQFGMTRGSGAGRAFHSWLRAAFLKGRRSSNQHESAEQVRRLMLRHTWTHRDVTSEGRKEPQCVLCRLWSDYLSFLSFNQITLKYGKIERLFPAINQEWLWSHSYDVCQFKTLFWPSGKPLLVVIIGQDFMSCPAGYSPAWFWFWSG